MPDLSVKQHRNDMHSNQERETYFSSFYEILKYFFQEKTHNFIKGNTDI